ncbi:MAG TPA: polysaccharide biosynthesis tyrosine autokinase [Candidatus Sulfotelmatobacter sp.]|jgi:succinoglycan biosynthesis transport protein ExoP|nr:polysaccharide biosynthesis tyrosine autokinase [Candidatus Sulfotelmatobacter sp.]
MSAQPGSARHLLDYWAVLRRRRGVIALSVATVTLATLVGSFLATPLYRSTVTLQIERQSPDILKVRDVASIDYSFAAYTDFYQTQYKILSSDAVARTVVERLGLTAHPRFQAGDGKPGLYANLRGLLPGALPARPRDPVEVAANRLKEKLEIAPVRNSHLVEVSWVAPEPKLAADVANAVVDSYVEFNIQSSYQTSDQAREFLVNQIATLRKEIAAQESLLQGYGETKHIVSADDESNITMKALSDIAAKRTLAETVLAEKEARFKAVRDTPASALPETVSSELIARLKQEVAQYEAEYSEKAKQFKDDWPGMQQLRSKMDQARAGLDAETEAIGANVRRAAEADYRQALEAVRGLSALLDRQQDAAQSLKRDAVEFKSLQSDVQKKRETLNALMTRQNEMALTSRLKDLDATSSNIRIVDHARPAAFPFRPDRKLNLLVGLVFGLTAGIALALMLDYLDNTIVSAAEIDRVVALPVLAVVPHHAGPAAPSRLRPRAEPVAAETIDMVAHRDRKASSSEAYRALRTALLLSNPGHPPREIMVTSALPDEGKSSTAINLAIVLAQMSRRVLLVDADLRRPRLHRAFRMDGTTGLSTLLSGLATDPKALVRGTPVSGLDVLPSGPVPPNPSELLDSPTFAELGNRLVASGYDHVIYDSPPALAVADPVIVASVVEVTVVVARAGRTPRESLRLAVETLSQGGRRPIGIVLNDFDARRHGYTTYGYYERYDRKDGTDGSAAGRAAGA